MRAATRQVQSTRKYGCNPTLSVDPGVVNCKFHAGWIGKSWKTKLRRFQQTGITQGSLAALAQVLDMHGACSRFNTFSANGSKQLLLNDDEGVSCCRNNV